MNATYRELYLFLNHLYTFKFSGIFRGVTPQIPRGMVGSSSQMVSFGFAKDWLRGRGWLQNNPVLLSFMGANLGGLVMTVCLNPFDVAATRLSNQRELFRFDRIWDLVGLCLVYKPLGYF